MNKDKVCDVFSSLAKCIVQFSASEHPKVSNHAFIQTQEFVIEGYLAFQILEATAEAEELADDDRTWSKASLRDIFFKHIGPFVKGQQGVEGIKDAVKLLKSDLSTQPREFEKILSVFGLQALDESVSFGFIEFLGGTDVPDIDIDTIVKNILPSPLTPGRPLSYAKVVLQAVDDRSAIERSRELLSTHLSIINALLSATYPSLYRLSHLHDYSGSFGLAGSIQENKKWGGNSGWKLNFQPLSSSALVSTMAKPTAKRASALMSSSSKISKRIRASYELVGNGAVTEDRATAFILFAIALESAVLPGRNSEITNQLSTRVAHLIADSLEERRLVAKRIKTLYGMRSKIVHEAKIDISDNEASDLKRICLEVLAALSSLDASQGINTQDALDLWFETKTLESGSPVS